MSDEQGLEGVRVLEVAGGIGLAYLAKLFGDLGADVVRIERDGDDGVRDRPHDVHRWVNANKRSVTSGLTDLVAGTRAFRLNWSDPHEGVARVLRALELET